MKKQQLTCMGLLCAIFWMGCSGGKYKSTTADSVSADSTIGYANKDVKLVKTADMRFKVKNVEKTTEDIALITAFCNGVVMHHTVHSTVQKNEDIVLPNDSIRQVTSYSTIADMVVKVPTNQTEDFMNAVSKMATYIDERNMDVQDRTPEYMATKMKAENRSAMVKAQKEGSIHLKDSTDLLSVKDDIVDRKISNLRTDADVKYSSITLNIYQSNTVSKDVVANDDPSTYRLPLSSRIKMAFQNGWQALTEIFVMLINLWPVFIICIAGWLGYRYYKNKRVAPVQIP